MCQGGPLAYRQSRNISHPKEMPKKTCVCLFFLCPHSCLFVVSYLASQNTQFSPCRLCFLNSVFMYDQSICMGTRPVICRDMEIFQETDGNNKKHVE